MSVPPSNPYGAPVAASSTDAFSRGQMSSLRLKQVDPLSCAKMMGALYLLGGLVLAVFFAFVALLGAAGGNNIAAGMVGGLIGAILMPLFYGVLGFIIGLVMAFLYNLCAGVIGGIEMQFEE